MNKFKYETREQWMQAAIAEMTPLFETNGYKVPTLRVACGWPSRGGLGKRHKTTGQCWSPEAAEDNISQIFISPWLVSKPDDADGVIPTLMHEVVHAVVGNEQSHNKVFKKCALAIGLEGEMAATYASKPLMETVRNWIKHLGPYPHGKLDPKGSPVKPQTARMIKMECATCGFVARTANKWLNLYGPVKCPGGHGETTIEVKMI